MIRSTKKEVKQAIREYLLDNMDFSGYGLNENEMTATEKVRKCYDIFREEKGYEIVPISKLILRENYHMDVTGKQLAD